MNLKRTLAIIGATLALSSMASVANATAHGPSKADKQALKASSGECKHVTDDTLWEYCVTGDAQLYLSHRDHNGNVTSVRAFRDTDYTPDGANMVALHASHGVTLKVRKASKADKRAIRTSSDECATLLDADNTADEWEACVIGAFTSHTGRVITSTDYRDVEVMDHDGEGAVSVRMTLIHASNAIAK